MDLENIYRIPIQDVATHLGIEVISKSSARCFNKNNHKHRDRNPSLIFGSSNTWRCAVCHFNCNSKPYGNNIDLVIECLRVEFNEALRWFSENFKVSDVELGHPNISENNDSKKITVADIEIYNRFIKLSGTLDKQYRQYLKNRGLSDFIIDQFGLSNVKMDAVKKLRQNFSIDELLHSGLFRKKNKTNQPYFTFFYHQLLFPFYYMDDIVYMQGRRIDDTNLRYKNLPKEIIFPYNANILTHPDISEENVLIVEGVIDTLTLLDKDIHAIGIIGAKNFKPEWVGFFDLYDVNPIIALDRDKSGDSGAQLLANIFKKSLSRVSPSEFGAGIDWNELVSERIP